MKALRINSTALIICMLFSSCGIENHMDDTIFNYPDIDVSQIENGMIYQNINLLEEYIQASEEFDKHVVNRNGKKYYEGPNYTNNRLFNYFIRKLKESDKQTEKCMLTRAFPRIKTRTESSSFTPISIGSNEQQTGEMVLSVLSYINSCADYPRFSEVINTSSFTNLLTSGSCTLGGGRWTWAVIRKNAAIESNQDSLNDLTWKSYESGGGYIHVDYDYMTNEPAITLHTTNSAAFKAVMSSNF